jgi:hypothetical protein
MRYSAFVPGVNAVHFKTFPLHHILEKPFQVPVIRVLFELQCPAVHQHLPELVREV